MCSHLWARHTHEQKHITSLAHAHTRARADTHARTHTTYIRTNTHKWSHVSPDHPVTHLHISLSFCARGVCCNLLSLDVKVPVLCLRRLVPIVAVAVAVVAGLLNSTRYFWFPTPVLVAAAAVAAAIGTAAVRCIEFRLTVATCRSHCHCFRVAFLI
jgi:hypothetical protein